MFFPKATRSSDARQRLRKIGRWTLIAALLVVRLAFSFENRRGERLWKEYREKHEAAGEKFDLNALIPKAVPAEQNFAATPFFAPYFTYVRDTTNGKPTLRWKERQVYERNRRLATAPSRLTAGRKAPNIGRRNLCTFTDLKQWQEFLHGNTNFPFATMPSDPATDVLTALTRYDDVVEEFRAASDRPYSVFPVHYDEHFDAELLHLDSLRDISEAIQLRAIAELQAGRSAEAVRDVQFGLRLADTLTQECFRVSAMVRIAMVNDAIQPIWEGLARQRLNAGEVEALQAALARVNILAHYGRAMRFERTAAIYVTDQIRAGTYRDLLTPDQDLWMARYLPGALFRQNQLAIARAYQERVLTVVNLARHRVDVEAVEAAQRISDAERLHPYNLGVKLLLPRVSRTALRFAQGQTGIELATIACALERYHISNGCYPTALDALTPEFLKKLPLDVITGEPLKYHVTNSNRFVLYSIGWNQRDEGGTPGLTPNKRSFDPKKGDWVWRYSDN